MSEQDSPLDPCVTRINDYEVAHEHAREIRRRMNDIESTIFSMLFQAAGGLGTGSRERAVEQIEEQITALQVLRDEVEELPDPREVRPQFDTKSAGGDAES